MRNNFFKISAFAFSVILTGSPHASPPLKTDEPMESAAHPKKKAGEECRSSDECKRHHTCSHNGTKKVCTAMSLKDIPKT